ncbi:hypothetical protein ACFYW6_37015 [Streptomyces sp. NPDC002659]|uniref:hypothetical protein n=1 Tax=Streptomyces sp. NPDC002659 TaxID=3364656 RepID=UPI003698D315
MAKRIEATCKQIVDFDEDGPAPTCKQIDIGEAAPAPTCKRQAESKQIDPAW